MIRVVYQWRVEPGQERRFVAAWARITRALRASRRGARGSALHRSRRRPARFVAIAYWDSYADWQTARRLPALGAEASAVMREASTLVSAEAFDVVKDLVAVPKRRSARARRGKRP